MGGGHTLAATNAHPDVFSYVGVFSMGTAADVSDKLEALKKAGVKFYYVGHGKDDPVVRVAQGQNLAAQLQKVGINYHYTESSGGHTWSNWRIYLSEFTPSLFK
jgi:enterochelin esterase family protein